MMLRAGKSIEFNKDHLHSHNGILLSPIINLCGLILRADRPVPPSIKSFLESNGVEVTHVQYKEELYVRLSGNYTLKKIDIEHFISEHSDLVNEQKTGLSNILPAINLQHEISEKVNSITEEPFYTGETSYTCKPVTIVANNVTLTIEKRFIHSGSRLASHNEININTKEVVSHGQQRGNIGFFADITAKTNMKITSQVGIQENALIEASNTLIIESQNQLTPSDETLTLNSMVKWFNNPHPNFFQNTESVDPDEIVSADEMLMRGID